jgi:hypothetical protein
MSFKAKVYARTRVRTDAHTYDGQSAKANASASGAKHDANSLYLTNVIVYFIASEMVTGIFIVQSMNCSIVDFKKSD